MSELPPFRSGNVVALDKKTLFNTSFDELAAQEIEELDIERLANYWSWDIEKQIYTYHSTIAAFQIAMYMGFDSIYLIGCDLGFGDLKPHMVYADGLNPADFSNLGLLRESLRQSVVRKSLVNRLAYSLTSRKSPIHSEYASDIIKSISGYEDENHFASDYRVSVKESSTTDAEHIKSHTLSKRIADDEGVSIYNATDGGYLEVYPRVDFDSVVDKRIEEISNQE